MKVYVPSVGNGRMILNSGNVVIADGAPGRNIKPTLALYLKIYCQLIFDLVFQVR